MENNQQKKMSNGLKALIALLLIITTLASCVGLYAWAKYSRRESGSAQAQIAKWHFDLKLREGRDGAQATEGQINLGSTGYQHVVNGKIAPGTSGEFDVILDTTGTEVDLVYEVTITITNCPRNINFTRKYVEDGTNNEVTAALANEDTDNDDYTRTLTIHRYLPCKPTNYAGISHTETIMWDWPYDLRGDGVSAADKEAYDQRDNDDNGMQASFTINAVAYEVMENPYANENQGGQEQYAADSVHTLAQTPNAIQRWDSVNYNPGTLTTASIELPDGTSIEGSKLAAINLPAGATVSETISATDASDWVVLDVNETTGEVKIIPRTYSSKNLTLNGMNGYNNAIQALNEVASIYLNPSYATSSRSLSVDDVNGVTGYDPAEAASASASGNAEYSHSWNHRYGMDANLNIVDYGEENEAERTYVSTPQTAYYDYNASGFSNWTCWLASRCVNLHSSYCDFCVRLLYGSDVYCSGLFGVSDDGGSAGGDYDYSYPVVPVVSLKSTVHMNKDSNDVWQLTL